MWNVRDDAVPWVARLSEIVNRREGAAPRYRKGEWRAAFDAAPGLFDPIEEAHPGHVHLLAPERVVDRIASVSFVAAMEDAERAAMLDEVRAKLPRLAGLPFAESVIECADDFSYSDPVDGSVTSKQGIRLFLANRSRVVFRLSGTGTQGATLRIYLERYDRDSFDEDPNAALSPMAEAVKSLIGIREHCHRDTPDVIT